MYANVLCANVMYWKCAETWVVDYFSRCAINVLEVCHWPSGDQICHICYAQTMRKPIGRRPVWLAETWAVDYFSSGTTTRRLLS